MNNQNSSRRRSSLRAQCSFVAIALSVAFSTPASGQIAWGMPATDVTPDPSIRYGVLPNGMRYAIKRNETPKNNASLRLRFEFGSIGESEKERGLAHFIEHMAFNGTTNVPEGEMVKILERQGLKFGPDTNAATGFDSTTYMLDLPSTDEKRLSTAFMLMREVASEVKFDPAAVDRERGVILGERRVRDTFGLRQITDMFGFQFPDTPYPNRLPIGTEEVLRTASAATMKDLYRRYYRPENATLVFVGDADPALIEQRIKAGFSNWQGVGPAGAKLPRGTIDLKRAADFDTFVDPAVATTISLVSFRPWEDPADTLAERRKDMVRYLGLSMFNRRLQRLVNTAGSGLVYGAMGQDSSKDAALSSTLTIAAKDGAWSQALSVAEQELRRALKYGFTAPELTTEKADALGKLQTAATQADARTHSVLVNTILQTRDEPAFVTTPAYNAEYFARIAPTITADEVNAEIRRMWSGSAPLIHVSAKEAIDENALAQAFTASSKIAVAAPKVQEAVAFGYETFGAPGKVVNDKRVADLGIRTVRFANNVMLNIKQTDFEKGRASFAVRMAGGGLAIPDDKPGLSSMMSIFGAQSATTKNSLEELKIITAGRNVTAGAMVDDDAFLSTGSTTAADLALQMKLSAAYLTDPGFRPEADSLWASIVPVIDKQLTATPGAVAQSKLPTLLANNDLRFGLPPVAELTKRSFAEAKTVVTPLLGTAAIEIAVVGDVDEAAVIKAVAESFGALPTRAAAAPSYEAQRKAAFRAERTPIVLTHSGGADQALVGAAWPTDDDSDYRRTLALNLLKEIIDLELTDEVREKLGASYGVDVSSTMSDTYRDFGYLLVSSVVAPDKGDEVDQAIASVVASLRDKPVSADILERARQPMLENVAKSLRQNSYWLAYLDEAQSEPERLDRIRQREKIIRSLTAADMQALAKQYLVPGQLQRFRILSDKAAAAKVASR